MQLETLLGLGISLIFIALLVFVYLKKAERDEKYIGWKLIGCFLLGTFTFRLETWVLPVGIAIFFIFILPKVRVNKQAKQLAAFIGAASFLSGILFSYSVEAYYEQIIHVKASTQNAFEMKFYEEYEKVKSALDPEGELAINNLELSFDKDGMIRQLNYEVYYYKYDRSMNAWIEMADGQYKIIPHVITEETDMMVNQNYISTPGIYFQALDLHGLKEMVPDGDMYYTSFTNSGELSLEDEKSTLWDIVKSGIQKHAVETVSKDEDAPIHSPYQISITSMKEDAGTNTYLGDQHRFFTISPELFN
ncbi:hypothetical protein [Fictibacillus barbaricus]|uniref:Uncharacterized protein n=1 Tax=Fictibacillus barbaricus TaxID=182136 RepID=A0ABS2Z9U1_9BACL|nr:hypothetical protein [Fictibacillus barbaricus]MBN3544665.1 hypothetical protein [Fictibacillus barbaricus]GGB64935.1 hypothetical protein GCM10007199_33910 [Fictibacillus barbaricus]